MRFSCIFLSYFGAFPVLLEFCSSSSVTFSSSCIVFASLQSWASLLLLLFSALGLLVGPPPGFPLAVLGLSSIHGVTTAPAVPAVAPPLFRPFAAAVPSDLLVVSSAPAPFVSAPRFLHAAVLAAPFAFGAAPGILLDEGYPDAVPREPDAAVPAFMPDSYRTDFRRMLSFIIDLFPQAAGSPSVPPALRALFEDFFAPASVPTQPIHLALFVEQYWFLWCFCLVRISGSLHNVVSLWAESGFAASSVSLGSQGYFMWCSPFCLGLCSIPQTHSRLRFP